MFFGEAENNTARGLNGLGDCYIQQRDEGAGGSYNGPLEGRKRPVCGDTKNNGSKSLMEVPPGQNTVEMQLVPALEIPFLVLQSCGLRGMRGLVL